MWSFFSYSQEILDIDFSLDQRYSKDDNRERLQSRVRIGFIFGAGGVEIVGLATTGETFESEWATYYNSNGSKGGSNLAFRNLYIRKANEKYSIEAGALSPEPIIGAAGSNPNGWVDGVRVKVNTKVGEFKVVAGSLGSFDQPNMFQRNFDLNFMEIEVTKEFFDKLMTTTAVERYNGDFYLRESVELDLDILGENLIKVFGSALVDFERNAATYEIGAEFDVLKTLFNKFEKRLQFRFYYSDINERIPDRQGTISTFYTYGPRLTFEARGKINDEGTLNWFARTSENFDGKRRTDVGVTYRIPLNGKKSNVRLQPGL